MYAKPILYNGEINRLKPTISSVKKFIYQTVENDKCCPRGKRMENTLFIVNACEILT